MCEHCKTGFNQQQSLSRHLHEVHETHPSFTCLNCGRSFKRKHNLKRHENVCNGGSSKGKQEDKENTAPMKKQKLSDAELIEYEVIII